MREVGVRAAAVAEDAWARLAAELPAPRRRVDLVVADNVDAANGYATTYPVPRIVVYALPPAGDPELDRYDDWLRLVITHELAHVFHLDLARGWWGLGRAVLGRAPFLFPNLYTPPWMREGLATFYESRLTGAGRLGSGYHRAIVAAEGVALDEASIATPAWPAGIRPYALGATYFGYVADHAGDSAVARFARGAAGKPIPWVGLSGAMRGASGRGVGAWWDGWQAGRLAGRDEPGPGASLARGSRLTVPPRLSPDGRRLLVAWNDGTDATRLVVIERGSGRRREVARLNAVNAVAWAGDGSMLVSQLEYQDLYHLRADLWRIGADGRAERLTSGARLLTFDVARDGALVAVRAVAGGVELVRGGPGDGGTGRRVEVIAAARPGIAWADPRFSPDGTLIAVVRVVDGAHDIVVLDRDGRLVRAMTQDPEPDIAPAWTPDGAALAWTRDVDGLPQVVGARLGPPGASEVAALERLSAEPYGAHGAAPAADSLFYLAYAADGWRLAAAASAPHGVPLSAAPPVRPSAGPPVPAGGPPVIASEHAYSPFPALLPQYWVPLVTTASGGAWLGAFSSSADPVERHAWSASAQVGTGLYAGRWQGAFAYTRAGPGAARFDASYVRDEFGYLGASAAQPVVCCDLDQSANVGVSLVRRRWRSLAVARLGAVYDDDAGRERAGVLVGVSWNGTVTPALAVSAQDGARLAAAARVRRRLGTDLASAELSVRAAGFRSLGRGTRYARPVLAARAAAGATFGGDLVEFGVGGESGTTVEIVPGLRVGASARTFPVRGYPGGYLQGRRALALSVEQRVPVALVARNLGLLPVGLDRVTAAAFLDAGAAFSGAYCGAGSTALCSRGIASAGAEVGTVVMLGYDFPMLLRVGGAVRARRLSGVAGYAAVGVGF